MSQRRKVACSWLATGFSCPLCLRVSSLSLLPDSSLMYGVDLGQPLTLSNLGILVYSRGQNGCSWLRNVYKVLSTAEVTDSVLISGHLKAIQQTLVNHTASPMCLWIQHRLYIFACQCCLIGTEKNHSPAFPLN